MKSLSPQQSRVLSWLTIRGPLSSAGAMTQIGVCDLPKRVSELRRLGYPIAGTRIESTDRYGNHTHYTRYTLAKQ